MTVAVGARLGPCEIQSPLGVGGMGEVYRARDSKLNRDIALKILPEVFALDPDGLARFKREAQVLASLNLPNIVACDHHAGQTRHREGKMIQRVFGLLVVLSLTTAPAVLAQWAKQRDPRVPSLRGGKPNLSAPTPRAADGKPDLSGVWWNVRDPLPKGVLAVEGDDFTAPRHMIDIMADLKPEQVQMEPWAEALFKKHLQAQGALDPVAHCQPFGVPSHLSVYPPHKIVQTPRLIVILHEYQTVFRQIFLDGRNPIPDPNPTWNGYSTGRWEGDTLVVDTVGFNDRSWLDRLGHPHSEALHVTERFRRRDVGHMDVEVTIEDPKAYRKPIVYTLRQTLSLDEDLLENFCTENEKDAPHYRP